MGSPRKTLERMGKSSEVIWHLGYAHNAHDEKPQPSYHSADAQSGLKASVGIVWDGREAG